MHIYSLQYLIIIRLFFFILLQVLGLFLPVTFAQIAVTYPVERSVFQRVNGTAPIPIGGNIQFFADEIQARVIPIKGGVAKDWSVIDKHPEGGSFIGALNDVSGGWYKLEVRAIVKGAQKGEISTIEKVGVGEVFIIAGQSNAQGGRVPDPGFTVKTYFGSTDDRVNCINFFDNNENSLLPFPKIVQINAETNIAPHGGASWCWALVGDQLAKNLNVPVLFFNTAVGATRVSQWAAGARGESVFNYYDLKYPPVGWPYSYLKKSINYYASLYGIRAILWQQGEEDSFYNISSQSYKKDLSELILKSREHFGKNISWVVAKVSRQGRGINNEILNAQQAVIDSANFNVYQGPDTDGIQPSIDLRDGGVHFHGDGLVQLANAWSNKLLVEHFYNKSTTQLANPLLKIMANNCENKNTAIASLSGNTVSPFWIWANGEASLEGKTLNIYPNQSYYVLEKDLNKNYLISAPFTFSPPNLEIALNRSPKICLGETLQLTANSPNNNFLWNTGETMESVFSNKSGVNNYKVSSTDIYGCNTKAEKSFSLEILPLPQSAEIMAIGPTTFCEGNKVIIKLKETNNFSKLWNTAETTTQIEANKSGKIYMQNVDINGCKSKASNVIDILVNPVPSKPIITMAGKPEYCYGDSLKLSSSENNSYLWAVNGTNLNAKTSTVYAKNEGKYAVIGINEYGCQSVLSEIISVKENKLPETPTIETLGRPIICLGDSISIFTKNVSKAFDWFLNNEKLLNEKGENIVLNTVNSGTAAQYEYSLRLRDENNCSSPQSNYLKITAKAKPLKPVIDQIGPFTLIAKNEKLSANNQTFFWYLDSAEIALGENALKVKKDGKYWLKIAENYVIDNEIFLCKSDFSEAYDFKLPTNSFFLYPNPVSNGVLFFETFTDYTNLNIRILSSTGNEVIKSGIYNSSTRNQIYVGDLNGYFIAEINAGGTIIRKNIFIKN